MAEETKTPEPSDEEIKEGEEAVAEKAKEIEEAEGEEQ